MNKTLEKGDVFHQEYEIISAIGRGGQGTVYAAEHITGRCALKVSRRLIDVDTKAFQREARLVTQCFSGTLPKQHGLIVGEHFGVCDNQVYCKMDLLEGEPLSAALTRDSLSIFEATRVALSVAESLVFAHSRRVLHRDLKPENIFLEKSGKVYVLDWGCLQVLEAGRGDSAAAGPMCTPGYAPLEQYRASRSGPHPTLDLYALGVVYYEMLSGLHPWTGWCRHAAVEQKSKQVQVPGVLPPLAPTAPTVSGGSTVPHPPDWLSSNQSLGPRGTLKIQIDPNDAFGEVENGSSVARPTRTQTRKPRQVRLPLNSILLLQERAGLVRFGGVPDQLWVLLEKLLAKNPRQRPQTAAEVCETLRELLRQFGKTPEQKARVDFDETDDFFTASLADSRRRKAQRFNLMRAAAIAAGVAFVVFAGLDWKKPSAGVASPRVGSANETGTTSPEVQMRPTSTRW